MIMVVAHINYICMISFRRMLSTCYQGMTVAVENMHGP